MNIGDYNDVSDWAIQTDDRERSGFYFWMDVTEITRRTVKGVPNVIVHARWRLVGELENCPECGETHMASFEGATPLIRKARTGALQDKNFDPETAIAYEDVTVEDVVRWVEDELSGDLHPFEMIMKQINDSHETGRANNIADDEYTANMPWMA